MHATPAPPAPSAPGRRAVFDAARRACLTGHPAGCTYGGLTASGGYWLVAPGCPRLHADRCAWCSRPASTSFVGWHELYLWGVPACDACARAYSAEHPDTARAAGTELPRAGAPGDDPIYARLVAEFGRARQGALEGAAAGSGSTTAVTGLIGGRARPSTTSPAAVECDGAAPHPACLDARLTRLARPCDTDQASPVPHPTPSTRGRQAAEVFTARTRALAGPPGIDAAEAARIGAGLLALAAHVPGAGQGEHTRAPGAGLPPASGDAVPATVRWSPRAARGVGR